MIKIIRYFSDGRKPKKIKTVSTLEIAKLHCRSALTRGVLNNGVAWFDGYENNGGTKR